MKILLLLLIVSISVNTTAAPLKNRLLNNASPYLAMHGKDPVAWQEWSSETMKRAKKENKLIYVSSGYFSCHWCHVMQKESYQNKDISSLLNQYFIPVKIDRELASALDAHLIDFVERTQGRAGWPLNVFITPDGYPLVGMTYVPADNFLSILNNINNKWKNERKKLESIAIQTTTDLTAQKFDKKQNIKAEPAEKYLTVFMNQVSQMSDDMSGGFGQQNKFPSVPQLTVLLKRYKKNQDKNIKQFLVLTLEKMASQGLHDHLEGGFFRYTVDPGWQIPHFEKMLYDNVLLASLYIDAAKVFNNKKFDKIAISTLDFLLKVFSTKDGVFISSLSALDNNGIEGGYYLWKKETLDKILNPDEKRVVELIWSIQGVAELDAGFHLRQTRNLSETAKQLKLTKHQVLKLFNSARNKMLNVRYKRKIPKDDKILAAWNGLALSAYSKAAKKYKLKRFANTAENIKNYLFNNLWKNQTLLRAVKNNKVLAAAELEDYAYVSQGLYDWWRYSKQEKELKWLKQLLNQAWLRFYGRQGWILAENMLLKYGQGHAVVADGVLPSASAVLIQTTLKYTNKTEKSSMREKAIKALMLGNLELKQQPYWYITHIQALYDYQQLNK